MGFSRTTNASTVAGQITDAAWAADFDSLDYLEGGAAISATDFASGLKAGSIVSVIAGDVKPYNGNGVTGLTRYNYDPTVRGVGSSGTMAIVVGGVVHIDKLPVMPTAAQVTKLNNLVQQNDSGTALAT